MSKANKEADAANDAKVLAYINAAPLENEYRILKKVVNKELWAKAKARRTPYGASLWDCLKSGIIMPDSKMGIYACDRESYDVFEDVFQPMILKYFNTTSFHCGKDYGDLSKKECRDKLDLAAVDTDKLIVSTRVRVARNVDGVAYAAKISPEDRVKVEKQIVDASAKFTGNIKGTYTYMNKLDEATQAQMVENHLLFHCKDEYIREAGMFEDWPNGRGAFYSDDKEKRTMLWVNEEDHMRVICLENGNDLLGVYTRLITTLKSLDTHLKVAEHPKWGFLASCPTNVGTGMRASVHVRIPLVSNLPCFDDLCKDMQMDIRGVHGEHSEKNAEGIYDISNRNRYGLSEISAISTMAAGVKNLIRIEMALKAAQGGKK